MHLTTNTASPVFLKLLAHDVRWQILTGLAHSDLRVQELVKLVDRPVNLVSYHLKQLRSQAVVREQRSSADGRDIYYSLDIERLGAMYRLAGLQLHPALGGETEATTAAASSQPVRVLFLCTHNRARSQMAEGLLRHLGSERVEACSAGSMPGELHPLAVRVLTEMGIDISGQRSKHIDEYQGRQFDHIITVCDQVREQCPVFPGEPDYIHWSTTDPIAAAEFSTDEGKHYAVFTKTANALAERVKHLLLVI